MRKNKVYDALIFLYKKEGNLTGALKVCYELINETFDQILDMIKSRGMKKTLYYNKKDEFIKFIDDTIETIESEEKENKKENENENETISENKEDHQLSDENVKIGFNEKYIINNEQDIKNDNDNEDNINDDNNENNVRKKSAMNSEISFNKFRKKFRKLNSFIEFKK